MEGVPDYHLTLPDGPDPQVPFPVTQLHPDVHGHLEGVPDNHSYPSQYLCFSKTLL